ncbi:sigma-E processing peptidase SpoIIGA [Feifania hominis]|uniref:Sporulation sigma-E factor-processing peptidase n=1 Tax=Feifania hominis TaxID=2763660 RepID=A0A926HUC9_9FIRM|nr:sigma-E processing peptidase SpoIIGA [Feifania hominis]
MERTIYVDVLFLVNLIINYLNLWLTASVAKLEYRRPRLFLGALLGSLYAVLIFLPSMKLFYTLVFKVLFSAKMVKVSFQTGGRRQFFKVLLCFYAINVGMGGGIYWLYYFVGTGDSFLMKNGVAYLELSPSVFAAAFCVTFFLLKLSYRIFTRGRGAEKQVRKATITVGERSVTLTALIDTGNSLRDPVTRRPIVLAPLDRVRTLIPIECRSCFEGGFVRGTVTTLPNEEWTLRFKLIPYSTIESEGGLLPAFRCDRLEILEKSSTRIYENIVVAVTDRPIGDGDFDSLLSAEFALTI